MQTPSFADRLTALIQHVLGPDADARTIQALVRVVIGLMVEWDLAHST